MTLLGTEYEHSIRIDVSDDKLLETICVRYEHNLSA